MPRRSFIKRRTVQPNDKILRGELQREISQSFGLSRTTVGQVFGVMQRTRTIDRAGARWDDKLLFLLYGIIVVG